MQPPPGLRNIFVKVNGEPVVWETCQTFSGSWGYYRDEYTWKSVDQLLLMLIDSVSKGGTALGDAIRKALDVLPKEQDRDQALLLITDGGDQDSYPLDAAAKVSAARLGRTSGRYVGIAVVAALLSIYVVRKRTSAA